MTEIVPGLSTLSGSIEIYSDEPLGLMPLRQEGIVITTETVFGPRLDVSAICP